MSAIVMVSNHRESGEEIAREVASRLGFTFVGDSLLEDVASRHATTVKKLQRAMAGDRSLFNAVTREREKGVVYIKAAVAELLTGDSFVYHGDAFYLVPPAITHVLRVGVVADAGYRVEQGMDREGLTRAEAEALVARRDKELARWVTELWGKPAWAPSLFDLRISIPSNSVQEASDLVCDAITKDALRMVDTSIKATVDFVLASRVQLALLEKGYYNSEVEADGGKVTVTQVSGPVPKGKLTRTVHALRMESQQDAVGPIARSVEGVREVEVHIAARRPPRALLVDDEQEYVTTLADRLEMRDIVSEAVYDGKAALDALDEQEPEVMILDLKMPGMDGLEVLRRVKAEHPDVQVIVVTGHGSGDDEDLALQLGAFAYLRKPVDISTLAERIAAASEAARHNGHTSPDPDGLPDPDDAP